MPADVSDYVLRWPRTLFRERTAELANTVDSDKEWLVHVRTFLRDAFTTSAALDEFDSSEPRTHNVFESPQPVRPGRRVLARLLQVADQFEYKARRAPYYSQRISGNIGDTLSREGLAAECHRALLELEERGYFMNSFGMDCVDDPSGINPADVVAGRIGRTGLWPTSPDRLSTSEEDLYDLLEVMHDLASSPRSSFFHNYGNCGWHYEQFSISHGQAVYRWTINTILERADIQLRLADEGEDRGRLAQTTTYDQDALASTMATRTDASTGDRVRHAIALFRRRDADEHSKRSACIALAGILEERRSVLKQELFTKDEGALFEIANRFAVRHQRSDQQGDYDPVFLDWVFWAFLSTIDLTDRLIERQQSTAP